MNRAALAAPLLLLLSGCAAELDGLGVRANLAEEDQPTMVSVFGRGPPYDREYAFDGTIDLRVHRSCTEEIGPEGAAPLHESEHKVTKKDFEESPRGLRYTIDLGRPLVDRQGTYLVSVFAYLPDRESPKRTFLDGDLIYTDKEHSRTCSN